MRVAQGSKIRTTRRSNDDPETNNEDNTDWQQVTGYQNRRQLRAGVDPNNDERRTRLSTELHPDVFFRDLE